MTTPANYDPRYPIGKFSQLTPPTAEELHGFIAVLAALPENLRAAVDGLSREQIDTPYRDGGWSVRQLVHHVADSHVNAYCRTRDALTENWPEMKPYDEALWAELADARTLPVEISLEVLDPLHRRWVALFESLRPEDWERGYSHRETGRTTLTRQVAMYSWHSQHHVAHITQLRKNRGW